jgi:hypothetical protein
MEDAIIDAPIEESADTLESPDTAVEGAEPAEVGAEATGESLSGAPLWKSIKDSFQGKDPKTVAQVRKAIYDSTEVSKRHPEGLKGIDAVLESVKRLSADQETPDAMPIEQVIEETLGERTFWREFDDKFQAGDPAVVGQMAEANPEAFQKLMPEAFNKFAEVNPDGYSSIVAKAVVGYFNERDIPLQIKLLDRIIPQSSDDPAVQQLIEGYAVIKKAFEGLSAMASKPISTPEVKKQEVTPQNPQNTEDPATRLRDMEWNSVVAPTSNGLMVTEVQKAAGNSKFTQPEIDSIKSKFREEINARVAINSSYQNSLKAYLKANNKAAYIQRVNSEHAKIIKGAAKRIVDDVVAARKTAPKAQAAQPAKASLPPEAGAIRYERIAGPPQTQGLKVDLGRTPQHMLVKSQAYIIGRKNPVTWARK